MVLTKTQVSELYVSIFNRASEKSGSQNWLNSGYNTDATAMANAMLATDDAKEYFGTSLLTDKAFVDHIYKNTLNKGEGVDEAGKAVWVEFLQTGASRGEMVVKMIEAIKEYQVGGSKYATADQATKNAAQQFANRVDVSDYTADTLETIAVSEINSTLSFSSALNVTYDAATVTTAKAAVAKAAEPVGSSFVLTTTQDNKIGTDGNDTFYAYASQNVNGATTNTLSTGDMIDGGKGSSDKIISSMINDETVNNSANFAPMPIINNVEEIRVQALENGVNATSTNDVVILDADQITGETKYASDSSRADLVITNVDITSTQITNDIKLEMKDTQQNSDFAVYFDQTSLKANPDKVVSSAQVIIQVADGAQVTGTTKPLANMTFDLSFTQDGKTYSFDNIESTDGTYTGLVTAIQVALAAKGLTQYVVALGDTFSTFTTEAGKSVNLDYTGNYVTITDSEGTAFSNITFAPEQKAGSAVAILLAQSNVNTDAVTTSDVIQSTITLDNVGRGSNGGEVIIGSTSASKSSTGVERINVIVENSSVVHDISSTNNALKEITLTNGTVKGNFVLTNASYGVAAGGGTYSNVKEADFTVGLKSITATDFDGNIVLGRDNNLVDVGSLSAAVNGDVTYNATLNDKDTYTATTGNGADTINITLDDNRVEANTDTDTAVTISTGAGNDTITVDEDNTSVENTTAKIDAGSGDDVIRGNDVSVTVTAGAGNDVVYAENTGVKALLGVNMTAVYTTAGAATDTAPHSNGTIHFLAGREVTVTIATNGNAAGILTNGYETSTAVKITASKGTLTTLADLNAAIVKAVNEDAVLSKIAKAYIDENNHVQVKYLVDGVQNAAAVQVTVTNPTGYATATATTTMLNEYRDLVKNSAVNAATVNGLLQTDLSNTSVSTASAEGSKILFGTAGTVGNTVTFYIGDDAVSYTATGVIANDTAALVDALIAKGYTAGDTVAGTVAVVTDKEITFTETGAGAAATVITTITNDQTLTIADIAEMIGKDSVDNDNSNVVNGNEGNDVIVLSSDPTAGVVFNDTVVWTGYNQGNDTIVHFETTIDKLDFTSYLTGTVPSSGSGSTSAESEVALTNTAVATEAFKANSINLISWTDLNVAVASATTNFADLTIAELTAALNADANNTIATTAGLYQNTAKSVLIIHNNEATVGNDGQYAAYELTYANTAVAAGTAKDFTVKLIGQFDLGDTAAPTGALAVGDFAL